MKILFFILGSVKDRILGWGEDNMKEILDEDVVFFGPIEESMVQINNRTYPIISFHNVVNIDSVFDQLPEHWKPDIVVCDVSTLNFIPDTYKCPVKTYLLGRDGWGDITYNRGMCEFFDFINYSIIDRKAFNEYKTNLLPLLGMPVSIPNTIINTAFEKRSIDIISISHYNDSFYHERYKIMYVLSEKLKNKYNIQFQIGIERNQIHTYYQKSKIVLDWAHTLSNRSYEAALNACLLFSHEDNVLMKEFWEPYKEYIPYNENNLIELMDYYLSHPIESETIINNMQKRFNRVPQTFGGTIHYHLELALDTDVDIQERIHRNENLNKSVFYHRLSTSFSFYYHYKKDSLQNNWKNEYYERINKAIKDSDDLSFILPPLIEAARFSVLINETQKAYGYLEKIKIMYPIYPWTYFLLACLFYKDKKTDLAIQHIQEAIDKGNKYPESLKEYPLPFNEHANACDSRRITNYMWSSIDSKRLEKEPNFFMHLSYALKGDIYHTMFKKEKAIQSYTQAIRYIANPKTINKLNVILFQEKRYHEILQLTEVGLIDSPYNTTLHLYLFIVLLLNKNKQKAIKMLHLHKKTLKTFKNNKRILVARMYMFFLILYAYVGLPIKNVFISKYIKYIDK